MSRLPCNDPSQSVEQSTFQVTTVDDLPISSKEIREATQKDPTLSKVLDYTLNGWPDRSSDDNMKPYYYRRLELSVENGCILWGSRVIIPPRFREQLLHELHLEHQGITRTRAFARSYLWWPKLDSAIEILISSCLVCKAVQPEPPKAPLHPWSYSTRPWECIHIDYMEKKGCYYLIVVDSYSKWLEVYSMNSMTAGKTIDRLRSLFARYGLPDILVSDNGGQFVSEEFSKFLKTNGIRHLKIPPYHAATNGQAERYVQTLTQRLTKHMLEDSKLSEEHCLANFLLNYRTRPNSTTGQSPAELVMKRALRTWFSLLNLHMSTSMGEAQDRQKQFHDRGVKMRTFQIGDTVMVRNMRGGIANWITGVVIAIKGPLKYLVRCGGRVRYVHCEHMRSFVGDNSLPSSLPEVRPESYQLYQQLIDLQKLLLVQRLHQLMEMTILNPRTHNLHQMRNVQRDVIRYESGSH